MTTFDSREKAFEDRYAHDAGMLFKAEARRNRMAGEWAVAEMGMAEGDIKGYVAAVIKSDLEEPGHEDVVRKIHGDFQAAGVDISDHRIHKKLHELLEVAKQQVIDES